MLCYSKEILWTVKKSCEQYRINSLNIKFCFMCYQFGIEHSNQKRYSLRNTCLLENDLDVQKR